MTTTAAHTVETRKIGFLHPHWIAWDFYEQTFAEINTLAAQRHLMTRRELTDVANDERITKYRILDDSGEILALGCSTNDLHAWPLISPAYFERIYPKQYAERTLWYIGFIGVAPGTPGGYAAMLDAMSQPIREAGGIALMDFCAHNLHSRRIMTATMWRLSQQHPAPRCTEIDTQTFVALDFGQEGQ